MFENRPRPTRRLLVGGVVCRTITEAFFLANMIQLQEKQNFECDR